MNAFARWVKARNEDRDMFDFCQCECNTFENSFFSWARCARCKEYLNDSPNVAKRHTVLRAFKINIETVLIALATACIILKIWIKEWP